MSNPQDETRSAPVVRTLKPPPEIWELVQPVGTRQFNPRRTLLTRLRLSATNLILIAIVVGVVLGVCTAIFRFRAANESTVKETSQPQVDSTAKVTDTPGQANQPTQQSQPTESSQQSPASPVEGNAAQPTAVGESESPTVASGAAPAAAPSRSGKRKTSPAAEVPPPDIASTETTMTPSAKTGPQAPKSEPQPGVPGEAAKKSGADSTSTKPTAAASLSRPVIAPPKSAPTPKPKVIQWP